MKKTIFKAGAFLLLLFLCIQGNAQLNYYGQSFRWLSGRDTATFSPQPNGVVIYGNSNKFWSKTKSGGLYWEQFGASGSNTSTPPASIINFTASKGHSSVDPNFIVYAYTNFKNTYYPGGSPPFNDVIVWQLGEHGYMGLFYDSIYSDGTTRLILKHPPVKSVGGGIPDPDEVLSGYGALLGAQDSFVDTQIIISQLQPLGFKAYGGGGGSGGWQFFGTFTSSFTLTPSPGEVQVKILQPQYAVDLGNITLNYQGINNYQTVLVAGTGGNDFGFRLYDLSGNLVTSPSVNDQIVVSGFGLVPAAVNCYQWKTTNNWLSLLSSCGWGNFYECWIVPTTVTSNAATLIWQSYPSATQYKLYRGASLIYTGTNLTYTDSGLTTSTQYKYSLKATVSSVDTPVSYIYVTTK